MYTNITYKCPDVLFFGLGACSVLTTCKPLDYPIMIGFFSPIPCLKYPINYRS